MAITRPKVRVFEAFAATTPIVATPTLAAFLVGPAYHIADYDNADLQASLLIGTYGDASAASDGAQNGRPLPASTAITVADPPANAIGALLDAASVQIVLEDPMVELDTGTDGVRTNTSPDEDLLTCASATFVTTGVLAGDRVVLTDDAGDTVVKFVNTVVSETSIRLRSNLLSSELSGSLTGIFWRIERAVATDVAPDSFVGVSGQTVYLYGGLTLSVDVNGDGVDETVFVASASAYVQYRSLRQDLADVNEVSSVGDILANVGNIDERNPMAVALSIALANSGTTVKYYGSTSDTGVGAESLLTAHTQAKDAIESRDDIYAIVPLTGDLSVLGMWKTSVLSQSDPDQSNFRVLIGSAEELPTDLEVAASSATGFAEAYGDATIFAATGADFETSGVAVGDVLVLLENLAADVVLAPDGYEQHTVASVVRGTTLRLLADAGHTDILSTLYYVRKPAPATLLSLAACYLVEAAGNLVVLGMDNAVSSPDSYVGQYFTFTGGTLDTWDGDYLIVDVQDEVAASVTFLSGGAAENITATAVTGQGLDGLGLSLVIDATDPDKAAAAVSVLGDVVTVECETAGGAILTTADELVTLISGTPLAAARMVITTASVGTLAAGANSLIGGASPGFTAVGVTDGPLASVPQEGSAVIKRTVTSVVADTVTAFRPPYRRLLDNSAAFQSGAIPVQVGDRVAVPADDTSDTVQVESIISDNRLLLDASDELPVASPMSITTPQALASYNVLRALSKSQQVDAVAAIPVDFSSHRAVLIWPPLVDLDGVTNARTAEATPQPAFYLAAAVGGLVQGLPSQKPLTSLGVSGISKLYYSNFYFSRTQIDTILAAGWMVFQQRTAAGQPYILRQVTTDVSTLEAAELSVVKNYDFVALAYKEGLDKFKGGHNIVPDTLSQIRTELIAISRALTRARLPKIGAPLLDASDPEVSRTEGVGDRVDVRIPVTLPYPLNQIDLYLSAS